MKFTAPFLAGLCFFALSPSALHAEGLTLHTAQEMLLQGNPNLQVQKSEQEKAQAQVSEAQAAYWPSLDVAGSYQYFTQADGIDVSLPPPIGTIKGTLGSKERQDYGLNLSYPLLLGGSQQQQVMAKRFSASAEHERLSALENQASLQLVSVFYAWQMAEASRQAEETVADYLSKYAFQVADLVKGGAALPSKEATAKARLLGAEVDLQTAMDLRDSLGRAAALLLGVSPDSTFTFAADSTSIDSAEKAPVGERPELAYLDQTSESLTHQEEALWGQNFPTLVGTLGYHVANPGLDEGSTSFMNYGVAGVQFNWNLFDGFSNRAQRSETRALRQEIAIEKAQQAAAFQEAELSAEKWRTRLIQSQEAAQASLDAAQMSLTETLDQRKHGTASDLDVLNAQVAETEAALQVQQLSLQQRLAIWQWRYARGENLIFPGE